jgi:methyl-accepting chemotaxis protein
MSGALCRACRSGRVAVAARPAPARAAAETMRQAATAMTEAASTVFQQAGETADGAGKASVDLASVVAAIAQLTASVDEMSRHVAMAAKVAREAVGCADNGHGTMRDLATAASRMGDVARLINTIGGQTNLLALNRTIEAARAGAAGKGFAAVAAEVKALAIQTAKATADIDGQINAARQRPGLHWRP